MATLHNRIGRRIYTTHATCTFYNSANKKVEKTLDVCGIHDNMTQLTNKICRKYKLQQVLISQVQVTSKFYSMTMDDFIKHATKITE